MRRLTSTHISQKRSLQISMTGFVLCNGSAPYVQSRDVPPTCSKYKLCAEVALTQSLKRASTGAQVQTGLKAIDGTAGNCFGSTSRDTMSRFRCRQKLGQAPLEHAGAAASAAHAETHLQQQPRARGGGGLQALPNSLRLPRRQGGGGQGSTCGAAPRAPVRLNHQQRGQRSGQATETSTGFAAGAHLRSIAKHGALPAVEFPGRPGLKEDEEEKVRVSEEVSRF